MKVVLFCGGLGTRIGGPSEDTAKPMVKIGFRPILWHVMKYYAHYGHKEFILCLGYKADKIKEYFLNYNECLSNDFTMSNGGKDLHLERCDIAEWKITFVDTGVQCNIGQRLKAVEKYLRDEEMFLAPSQTFHVVSVTDSHLVQDIRCVRDADIMINGGYFVFRNDIFRYIRDGADLVDDAFQRLMAEGQLIGYKYDKFWCMDTFKEHQELTDIYNKGNAPWEVWKNPLPLGAAR